MGLTNELIDELRRDLAPMLLNSGRSAVYVGIGRAPDVAHWIGARQLVILGLEGFDCDGERLTPRLEFIADLSDMTDPDRSADVAARLLMDWRGKVQWIDFEVTPAT